MSIDTYLCLCCLSTNDLCNLYDKNAENNYVNLLKDMFRISPSEDAEDDYICKNCVGKLKEANSFKNQVLKSIDTLKVIGLINIQESNGNLIINKVSHIADEENDIKDVDTKTDIKNKDLIEDKKPDLPIIVKQVKENNLGDGTITKNSDIIRSFLANDPVKKLERHIATSARKSSDATPVFDPKDLQGEDLRCKTCDEKLPNLYAFHIHLNKHFPNHICEICGKGYVTERKLKRHKYSHVAGPFVCQDCGLKFTNYSTYITHRRKHTNPLPYKCQLCGVAFISIAVRARHSVTAHDLRPKYSCQQCSKEFLTSGLLSTHIKNKHAKTKPHKCSDCGSKFVTKQDLTGHMARHTGHKVFECHLCDKSYPRKKALIVHLRGHNNDKRFACEVCDKKFIQKSTLTAHLKSHNRAKKKGKSEESNLKIKGETAEAEVTSIEIEPYNQVKKEKNRKIDDFFST